MAKFILPESGTWVGPPALKSVIRGQNEVLDGSKRLKEYHLRGLSTVIPWIIIDNHYDAVKYLILANHHARAAAYASAYVPVLVDRSSAFLSAAMNITEVNLKPYLRALKSPAERHKLPRRAMAVVRRARELHARIEQGDRDISIQDLETVLGEFLK